MSAILRAWPDEGLRLTLPFPPLGNRYYRNCRGRMVLSKKGREYKDQVLKDHGGQQIEGEVRVWIRAFRPRRAGDIDSVLKCALDALQGVAYANDKQIIGLYIDRDDDKKRPRLEVLICPAQVLEP